MTSNLGTSEIGKSHAMGFKLDGESVQESEKLRASIEKALKTTFRPELLNRIDEIVIFDQLTEPEIAEIVDLLLADLETLEPGDVIFTGTGGTTVGLNDGDIVDIKANQNGLQFDVLSKIEAIA